MKTVQIKALVEKDEYLRSKLFCRGYLITDRRVDGDSYPFYGKWKRGSVGRYTVLTHPQQSFYHETDGKVEICLIGHAYHLPSGEINESNILRELLKLSGDRDGFFTYFNGLTGVFCLALAFPDKLIIINDAVSLQTVYYTEDARGFCASSHINLIGDLAGFVEDEYVSRLKKTRNFYLFGNQLPGDISRFSEVKLLIPNHCIRVGEKAEPVRFYNPHGRKLGNEEIIKQTSELLQKTMRLIADKWERPAISLTGGCDSKTTLAATNGLYDRYMYFSYDSQPNEVPDVQAARAICDDLGLPFVFYKIPYSDDELDRIEGIRQILMWNGGDIRANNPNDVRKRAYLDKISDFDVEVKSWASEIGRERYSKRYLGKKSFGKIPKPRKCTTFYKFLTNRKAVNETDKVFADFIDRYYKPDPNMPIPWQDQFYWEWHWPSRDGITLSCEHMFSDVITVPYNNRLILELLLSPSQDDRYRDTVYTEIRSRLDPRIDGACEGVVDVNHSKKRARLELLYYRVNNLLPY